MPGFRTLPTCAGTGRYVPPPRPASGAAHVGSPRLVFRVSQRGGVRRRGRCHAIRWPRRGHGSFAGAGPSRASPDRAVGRVEEAGSWRRLRSGVGRRSCGAAGCAIRWGARWRRPGVGGCGTCGRLRKRRAGWVLLRGCCRGRGRSGGIWFCRPVPQPRTGGESADGRDRSATGAGRSERGMGVCRRCVREGLCCGRQRKRRGNYFPAVFNV